MNPYRMSTIVGEQPTPQEVVRAMYDAFAARDVDSIFARLDPDIGIFQAGSLPWSGRYRGHDEAGTFFVTLAGAITSAATVERWITTGDRVVAVGTTRGTANATGEAFEAPFVHVWQVRGDAVLRFEAYVDHAPIARALG